MAVFLPAPGADRVSLGDVVGAVETLRAMDWSPSAEAAAAVLLLAALTAVARVAGNLTLRG